MAKEPRPREGETGQMEGLGLENVIERAQGHDAEGLGEICSRYVRRVFGLCRYMLNSRESAEDATSEVFLKLQRSGEDLGWNLPGEDASEALGSHEGRLDARTLVGPLDPHYRWVHPVSRRVGPPGCGLPGLGSFCRPALSEFPTGINGLKGVGSASSLHRSNELRRKPTLRSSVEAAELAAAKTEHLLRGASSQATDGHPRWHNHNARKDLWIVC